MRATDEQVLRLQRERSRGATIERAAMKAGMHRNTASRYLTSGELPSEAPIERRWRTHEDPFEADWPQMAQMLEDAPELEAKALFWHLQELHPGRYPDNQLRTFQRRVKSWRAKHGPDKEIFFVQAHVPGEAAQTDFTWATEFGITIRRIPYDHMLCVSVLPYSLWQWATPCQSESMLALKEGVQNAFFELGFVPDFHQTDHSTAATHEIGNGDREFNEEYLALTRHLSMKPRTTQVGAKEQNGSVEATNGALKRAVKQQLLLRGSTDFKSRAAYREWLEKILRDRNAMRGARLKTELGAMTPLGVRRLPSYSIVNTRVTRGGTIRVKSHPYSVPSRLIGERVRVRVFEEHLEIYLSGELMARRVRVRGVGAHNVSWRDVIGELVRKPGAFRRYQYRDAVFPSDLFRRAYERLDDALPTWVADMNYLQVVQLARDTTQHDVERALGTLEDAQELPRFEAVAALAEMERPTIPEVHVDEVEFATYDELTPDAAKEITQ